MTGAAAVAIAVVVACLIWAGCSWIYAIFVALCPGGVCVGIIF